MIQIGFLLLLCIAAVTPAPAPAPAQGTADKKITCIGGVAAASNFNASLFGGTWYEVRNFFPTPGRKGTCEAAKYTANKDGTLKVDLGWVDTSKVVQKRTGLLKPSVPNSKDAQFIVTLDNKSIIYTIFYLAYSTFFAAYACIDSKADVWIFARQREVSEAQLQGTIYPIMQTKYPTLSPLEFSVTIQKGCKAVV